MHRFSDTISTTEQLQDVLGEPSHAVAAKTIGFLDDDCAAFIGRSPYVMVASRDAHGNMDVSPRGDPPGFVLILDERTLVIPERPGNRRADTFHDVLENPAAGLIFLIPGITETLRVSGRATVILDADVLARMEHRGKRPQVGLAVHVTEAFFHGSKSLIRSHRWQPDLWPDGEGVPTLAEAMVKHGNLPVTTDRMHQAIEDDGAGSNGPASPSRRTVSPSGPPVRRMRGRAGVAAVAWRHSARDPRTGDCVAHSAPGAPHAEHR